jgi:hypothetical protein
MLDEGEGRLFSIKYKSVKIIFFIDGKDMKIIPWLLPSLLITVPVFAEGIATNRSVGAVQNFTGAAISIPPELGKTVGNNLFHSFLDLNINTGQTVLPMGVSPCPFLMGTSSCLRPKSKRPAIFSMTATLDVSITTLMEMAKGRLIGSSL